MSSSAAWVSPPLWRLSIRAMHESCCARPPATPGRSGSGRTEISLLPKPCSAKSTPMTAIPSSGSATRGGRATSQARTSRRARFARPYGSFGTGSATAALVASSRPMRANSPTTTLGMKSRRTKRCWKKSRSERVVRRLSTIVRLRPFFQRSNLPHVIAGKGFDVRRYDPLEAPEPEEWLALDEAERIRLAERYHRRAHIRVPSIKAHAAMHVVVENQIALGDELPVRATLDRLVGEGLDRHEAMHAIGLVLAEYIYDLARAREPETQRIESYYVALERLTADYWRRSG